MSKLKILYTIPNFRTAGSQYVLLSLYRRIDEAVFDPYICVEKYPEVIPDDIPADRRLVFEWTGNKLRDILNFKRLLKKHKIDIVHSWDYKSNYLESFASNIAGVKYLYTKKNNAWSNRWKLKSLLSKRIAYDNPEMKDRFFSSSIFQNKITFIPHGVDTEVFKPMEKIPSETFNIGCIGSIGYNKNQLFVIKALKNLPANILLHLYGNKEKDYKEKIDEYIIANDLKKRVHFHGYLDNKSISETFRKIDLFVLASFQEGLPVSLMEAMACGVPVLSSDSGGGAKFILKEGGGYIFDLKDFRSLVSHLKRLVQNPEEMKKLAIKGRKNVEINFSIQKEITAYEKLYLTIVK